jgi:hypothetical protein
MIKVFLAGIMQGSYAKEELHPQDYRARIKELLARYAPEARVYCPVENHPKSLGYSERKGREVFFDHLAMAATCDVLLAYLPEASMGTAVEMWEAHRNGRAVLTVSSLGTNWTVKFLSTRILKDLDELEKFLAEGELERLVKGDGGRQIHK